MLQQMLGDDKAEEVRESVVRSLAVLMAFIDEPDKFAQVRQGCSRACWGGGGSVVQQGVGGADLCGAGRESGAVFVLSNFPLYAHSLGRSVVHQRCLPPPPR